MRTICSELQTWLDDQVTPPAVLAKCKVCNGITSLLLQLHADLRSHFPNDDRRLHVLCCRKRACSRKIGSVRAFREVRKPAARSKPKAEILSTVDKKSELGLGTTLFGGTGSASSASNANPFAASNPNKDQQLNPFSSPAFYFLTGSDAAAAPCR